jgi:hypothetical protein
MKVSRCGGGEVKTFSPTWEEFKNFYGYIRSLEEEGVHKYGIVKVNPLIRGRLFSVW